MQEFNFSNRQLKYVVTTKKQFYLTRKSVKNEKLFIFIVNFITLTIFVYNFLSQAKELMS